MNNRSARSEVLLKHLAERELLPPKVLTVSITSACNLKCEHCWVECPEVDEVIHLSFKDFQSLIRDFIELGLQEVCITGGEPLLHPQWQEFLTYCCNQPELNKIILQTNGTLLGRETIRNLPSAFRERIFFQISLDGGTESAHDLVRGAGSFNRAMQGINCLVEEGFSSQTTIAFTEMEHNFDDVPLLLEIAADLGLSQVVGIPLINSGCAEKSELIKLPSVGQYIELLKKFDNDEDFRGLYKKIGRFSAIEWAHGQSKSVHGGCRFLEKPYVTADGLLYPCVLLQSEGFAGHDIFRRTIFVSISKVLPLWTELLAVSHARTTEMACTKQCSGGKHCGGGCLARAFVSRGDLTDQEDRCELRQGVYARQTRRL